MDKHWHFDHLLWPWPWKQQTNLSARHAGSWWWITIPSLVTKCLLAFRYHLDKRWRLTFAVILTLLVVTIFSQNTLAYDVAPPHQVWKQNVLWFRRYHPDKHSLTFWIITVTDNHILLHRLQNYLGVSGSVVNWFQLYLSNRQQIISINNVQSDPAPFHFGVPLGSVLGPILFVLYNYPLSQIL